MKITMNKEDVILFLQEYRALTFQKEDIEEQMFSAARLLRDVSDGKEGTASKGRIGRFRRQMRDKVNELKLTLAAVTFRRQRIERAVAALPPTERAVIERYYLTGDHRRAAEELMEELGYEKSQIYRLRESALQRIGQLLTTVKEQPELFSKEDVDEKA